MSTDQALIQKALEFHEEINQLIFEHRVEKWLSVDLTISQLKSLIYINSKGKANLRQLSEALSVSPSVVTGIVDRLIAQGMLNRVKNPEDRRVQWLVVTDKGETMLDSIRQKGIKEISQILSSLSEEDLSALVQGFSALLKAVRAYPGSRHKAEAD